LPTFDGVNKHVAVHMSEILCCPVAWIPELRSIRCLSQTRPTRQVAWHSLLCFHLIHTKFMDP